MVTGRVRSYFSSRQVNQRAVFATVGAMLAFGTTLFAMQQASMKKVTTYGNPRWSQATVVYRKYQNMDPVGKK
eukprot:CAMPEP_0118961388 /NCGR_PEP_ID=MMETSP1173-20130426/75_1 /TAXON_ID=1034831 /ORGANISM="Rhizochromulina marina cf, Strain CCMP1243" /LENGTH=72 /DNA_ID=CAMNT_0006909551 /DNA_START=122 /DNA_END=340 /DNA_ORIENTATION=-